ncbi:MAG TPA: SCO family protein [Bryobacteraceae bacterium]
MKSLMNIFAAFASLREISFLPSQRRKGRKVYCSILAIFVMASCAFAGGYDSGTVGGPQIGDPTTLPPGFKPLALEGVGVDEHLGLPVDLTLTFTGEDGSPVPLQSFFHHGRPVILDLVYYRCPMLCNLILNGQTETMRQIPWTPGNEYEVVTISIDPRETEQTAQQKKATYLKDFEKPAPGWHFLTDYNGHAKTLAEEIGFHYRYDRRQDQYAHPAAIMVLTPEGKIARYLYGIRFRPVDLRFALAEASEGRMTLTIQKILLLCYHYDPVANRYVLFASNLMKGGGVLTVALLAFFIWRMFRSEKLRAVHARVHREGTV